MRKAFLFCFETQGDRPKIASEDLLTLMELRMSYKYGNEWDVVDIETDHPWDPDKKFEELPRAKMASINNVAQREN